MAQHKHAEVLKAIADGKKVQMKNPTGDWLETEQSYGYKTPLSYPELEWRIKPEPVIVYKFYKLEVHYEFIGCARNAESDLFKNDWDLRITIQDGKAIKAELAE